MKVLFKLNALWILLLLIFSSFISIEAANTTQLQLQVKIIEKFKANDIKEYNLNIDSKVSKEAKFLFIEASLSDQHKFQSLKPQISVFNSQKKKIMICNQVSSQFNKPCYIQLSDLKQNENFSLLVKSYIESSIQIEAYVGDSYKINLGQQLYLQSFGTYNEKSDILLKIPQNLQYDQIKLYAVLDNSQNATNSIQMLVNVGINNDSSNIQLPETKRYDFKANGTSNELSVNITKSDFENLLFLRISLSYQEFSKVRFYSTYILNNFTHLQLGNYYNYHLAQNQTANLYFQNIISSLDLELIFFSLEGQSQLILSSDQHFQAENSFYISAIKDNSKKHITLLNKQFKQKYNLSTKTYFKIQCSKSTNCSFVFEFRQKSSMISLNDNINAVVNIQNREIKNFIYEDSKIIVSDQPNLNYLQQYFIYINKSTNLLSPSIGVRRCKSMEQNGTFTDCFIEKWSDLQINPKKIFNEIKINIEENDENYIFGFSYDVSKCPITEYTQTYSIHRCNFHVLFYNPTSNDIEFIFQLRKNELNKILTDNSNIQGYLTKGLQNWYSYNKIPDLNNTDVSMKTNFHLTVIEGDCIIFGSKSERFPEFHSIKYNPYDIGLQGYLSIQSTGPLREYFISVYCYTDAHYSLSTTVQSNKNDWPEIQLNFGNPLHYTLKNQDQIYFSISGEKDKNENVYLQIDEIQGDISYKIRKNGTNQTDLVKCDTQQKRQKKCNFTIFSNEKVFIEVSRQNFSSNIAKFSIGIMKKDDCLAYPINIPQHISLNSGEKFCSNYKISKFNDLQIVFSMSQIDFLFSEMKIYFESNKNSLKINLEGMQKYFTGNDLQQLCQNQYSQKEFLLNNERNCELQIVIQGSNTDIFMTQVVEYTEEESILLNGISKQSIATGLNRYTAKRFYYYGQDWDQNPQDIKLSFQSFDNQQLMVVARFQSAKKFETNPIDYYPAYPTVTDSKIFTMSIDSGQKIGSIYIPQESINCSYKSSKQNKQGCVLLISVFGKDPLDSNKQTYSFNIQINQGYNYLDVGESNIQIVYQNQIQYFEVQSNDQYELTLQILDLNSLDGNQCFKASIFPAQFNPSQSQGQIVKNGNFEFKAQNIRYSIEVSTKNEMCKYQISLSKSSIPTIDVQLNEPRSLYLEGNSLKYLLYYHRSNKSFSIFQEIQTGSANIYVVSVNNLKSQNSDKQSVSASLSSDNKINNSNIFELFKNQTLLIQKLKNSVFRQTSDQIVQIDSKSSDFCSNCYYLIAIESLFMFKGAIAISEIFNPTVLSPNTMLKQKIRYLPSKSTIDTNFSSNDQNQMSYSEKSLKTTEYKKYYNFFSNDDWNININMIYGRAKIMIINPSGKTIIEGQISPMQLFSKKIQIEGKNKNVHSSYGKIFDQRERYEIYIIGLSKCLFTIQTYLYEVPLIKLYENIPLYVNTIQNQTTNSILIENYYENQSNTTKGNKNQSLNLLISNPYLVNYSSSQSPFDFEISLQTEQQDQVKTQILNKEEYNIEFKDQFAVIYMPMRKATYNITLKRKSNLKDSKIRYLYWTNYQQFASLSAHKSYMTIPINWQTTSETLLPVNENIELYVPRNSSILVQIYSCGQKLKFFAGSGENASIIQLPELTTENNNGAFQFYESQSGQQMIYLKGIGVEVYLRVENQNDTETQQLILVDIIKNPPAFTQGFGAVDQKLSYQSHMSSFNVKYKKIKPSMISSSLGNTNIQYQVYLSDDKKVLQKKSFCGLSTQQSSQKIPVYSKIVQTQSMTQVSKSKNLQSIEDDQGSFELKYAEIEQNLGYSPENLYITVKAQILEKGDQNSQPIIVQQYTYETMILQDWQYKALTSGKIVYIMWIILISAIIGFFLYLLLGYGVKRIRRYFTPKLIQQNEGNVVSDNNFPSYQNKLIVDNVSIDKSVPNNSEKSQSCTNIIRSVESIDNYL